MEKKSWNEFMKSGLFTFTNSFLHIFGWAIVIEKHIGTNIVKDVYPARVKFRGFKEETNTEMYQKISEYMVKNANELEKEAKE